MKLGYLLTAGGLAASGLMIASLAVVRQIVRTDAPRRERLRVLAVDNVSSSTATVTLSLNEATRAPGHYAIWFDSGRGYAQLGGVLAVDERASIVTRVVVSSRGSRLRAGLSARWSGVVPSQAVDVGLPFTAVIIPTALGPAPAYRFDAPIDRPPTSTWAIHIHGQGASRAGPLRGVPVAHRAGLTSLVVSYRNDQEAPSSRDRKSMLGQTEWHDIDAALEYAVAHGAESIILVGWSMGAIIALQLTRSAQQRKRIAGLCLIAPVVDWRSTILAAGRRARVPAPVTRLALGALGSSLWRRATGLQESMRLSDLNWINNGRDLNVPTLVLHSSGDRSVPITLSQAFADAHTELVELVTLPPAPHTLEWNRSPHLWEDALSDWLHLLQLSRALSRSSE
ncbi:alpha/beta fold hydrolase [Cryobacterium sp. TMS1-20-1]|uniref:alpha/beta hydrolase family protein n=1 Tax=Cryobacterium sp. TMS1-20-1 TaxID=1259223 RepID=UPI001069A447|nr:alpha/beta fold hydrolase [Cryobacterium sp. TMS1-20-1]TFC75896.1 alpha/beta fold hydrolase [Cryobacterium sp. TMS1-20-1]